MNKIFYIFILFLYCIIFGMSSNNIQDVSINNNDMRMDVFQKYTVEKTDTTSEYIPVITINKNEKIIGDRSLYRYLITEDEFNEFVRVVEAEVTGDHPFGVSYEDAFQSKLRVAQVILNRVESPHFPNTVHDVIFQKNAFTPLVDGRYWKVDISQVTIDACKAALLLETKDITNKCEFFSSGTKTCKYGSYVFTDKVGHSFFKSYRSI